VLNAGTSATTAAVRASMRDCSGVLFILIGATSGAVTINESNAASGGTTQNAGGTGAVFPWWTQNNGVWTRQTPATVTGTGGVTAAAGGLLAVYVSQGSLSDGFNYVSASHGAGSFVYLMSDLDVQRKPENLRDFRA
jgi:hypothetical protein